MEIKNNKWWNTFPKNPTQTQYLRFLKSPKAKFGTQFEKSLEDFDKKMKEINNPIKTEYSDYWREL